MKKFPSQNAVYQLSVNSSMSPIVIEYNEEICIITTKYAKLVHSSKEIATVGTLLNCFPQW